MRLSPIGLNRDALQEDEAEGVEEDQTGHATRDRRLTRADEQTSGLMTSTRMTEMRETLIVGQRDVVTTKQRD